MTHTDTPSAPEPQKPKRWIRILLGVSLALNLLVVGLVIGAAYRFHGHDGFRPSQRSLGALLFSELPREDRAHLRKGIYPSRKQRMEHREAEMQAVLAALRSPQFDADAVDGVLTQQVQQRQNSLDALQRAWIDRVAEMTHSERLAYADRLEEAVERRGHDKGRKDKDRN